MGGGVPGTQASQSGGQQQAGTGKFGGMASQGGGGNPFQQFQGMGVQQAAQQTLGAPQTQQQQPFQGQQQYRPQQYQQQPMQQYQPQQYQQQQPMQQPFQGQQYQRPFQAQQPNYASLFNSLASMFGGQQGGAPRFNYNPVQSANNFQLRNTYQFDPATDASRQYAARVQADTERKTAEDAAAQAAAASVDPGPYTDPGSPGNARGGRINSPNKKIRAALLTAKGVQAKAVPGKSKGGDVAPGAPITAYHTTYEPFEEYDWSKLGKGTKENQTDDDPDSWAMTLAKIGPWAHQYPLNERMGYKTSMPVSISGKGKAFGSLNSLHAAVKKTGGVEPFRKSLLDSGFEHVVVKDEEFGKNKSYVALHPGAFAVKRAGDAPGKAGGGEVEGGRVGYAGGGGEDDPTVQKALGLTQGVQPTAPQMARRLNDQGMYSHAAEVAAALPQAKGSPQQMKATLKGVKQEELAGFDEAFGGRPSVTRDEMAHHFNDRMPQIETKVLGGEGGGPTQYSQYTLPGGENYREMLLKTPENPAMKNFKSSHWTGEPNVLAHLRLSDRTGPSGEKVLHVEEIQSDWGQQGREEGFLNPDGYRKWKEARNKVDALENAHEELVNNVLSPQFQTNNPMPIHKKGESIISHYEDVDKFHDAERDFLHNHPEWIASQDKVTEAHNELVPLRKALLREGKTPTGPYVGNTQAWTDLALKAALREAAHGNYDRVAWTQGHDQANRYGLIKNMHQLAYDPEDKDLSYYNKDDGWDTIAYNVEPEEVHKHIGQEAAKKLLAQPLNRGNGRQFLDVDMQSGGEGMKSYYDKIVPNRIMDVAKKAGASVKVEPHKIDTKDGEKTLHSIRMTPELRASIMRGLPVYKAGGSVGYADGSNNSTVRHALSLTKGMN